MNNSEDNSVGKQQQIVEKNDNKQVNLWAHYLKNMLSSTDATAGNSQQDEIIQQLFAAHAQGDSCLNISAEAVQKLVPMLTTDAEQHIAPFVYDGHALYLYRYYALESTLAQQVVRLKNQHPITANTKDYDYLLVDPQQRQALNMVGQQALSIITGGPGTGKTYTLARIVAV
ncbi:MAG: exodeoxyribonuclease V subunit alpha, partial [Acinetobacter sp.]